MWNRAKRVEKGEKIDPAIWTQAAVGVSTQPERSVEDEEEKLRQDKLEFEMTERGYGSDAEADKED